MSEQKVERKKSKSEEFHERLILIKRKHKIPSCCQKLSHFQKGKSKRRHVSKNTVTSNRISSNYFSNNLLNYQMKEVKNG